MWRVKLAATSAHPDLRIVWRGIDLLGSRRWFRYCNWFARGAIPTLGSAVWWC